jgi:hypothetical protein
MKLTRIANKYDTDKGSRCSHNPPLHFTQIYEMGMRHLRNKPIKLLEIGIDRGNSLHMWAEYFPNATIFGADIDDKSYLDTDRIKTFRCDQGNRESLKRLIAQTGDVDVIIDDGSHVVAHQQITLSALYPHTKMYWIEDLHTSDPLWQGQNLYGYDMSFPEGYDTVSVLMSYIETGRFNSPYLTANENAKITGDCQIFELAPTKWGANKLAWLCSY